jgi:hypothetical protein
MQLASVDHVRKGAVTPAYANTAGQGPMFHSSGSTIGEAVAKATELAGNWQRIGSKLHGPAAVAVMQAKDGAFYTSYLSTRAGENWWPFQFDELRTAVRHTDALKAIVGASSWIKFEGPAVAPAIPTEPNPINE